MEFRAQDVAQLVLGYLKDSKCNKAFNEFLNTCVHLQEHAASYRSRQFFVTRVSGLSLIDYLNEYALIYTLVQERLEACEYFKENEYRTSLVKQLLFLLEKLEIHPCRSTPISQEILFNSCNVTPTNTARENSFNNSKNNTTLKVDKSVSTEDESDFKDKSHEKCGKILTNTFLENTELIEKLADNINKEVSSKSNTELDSTTIESIVQRTEADPIFVQFLNELIEASDEDKRLDEGELVFDKLPLSERQKENSPSKKNVTVLNETNIKSRLRSSKQQVPALAENNVLIETQNDDAVQSICMHASSFSNDDELSTNTPSKNATDLVLSTEQGINITPTLYTAASTQNSVFPGNGNLLMIQPTANISTPNVLPSKTLTLDAGKPCYLIGNQSFVNVNAPSTPLKLPSVLSEQDILSMPTIFVCDTSQQFANSQRMIVPTNANVITTPRYSNIVSRQTPEKVQSLSEFITLYKYNDTISSPRVLSPIKVQSKQVISNRNPLHINTESNNTNIDTEKHTKDDSVSVTKKDATQTDPLSVFVTSSAELKPHTPLLKIVEKKDKLNRTTPKSSTSHIRQLDFSTPEKWISLPTEPKIKITSVKNIRTTLFKSPCEKEVDNVEHNIDDSKKPSSLKTAGKPAELPILKPSWDASLRVFQVAKSPVKNNKDKNKRKRIEDPAKHAGNVKKMKENSNQIEEIINDKPLANNQENVTENSDIIQSNANHKQNKTADKRVEKSTSKKKSEKSKKKCTETAPNHSSTFKSIVEDNVKPNLPKSETNVVEKSFHVINRNMNSKFKKKIVPKIKSLEVLDDNKSSMILSSSNINANKRSLVEVQNSYAIEQIVSKTSVDLNSSTNSETKKEEFVDSSTKINSLPLLQTPVKVDVIQVPKTPCINTSIAIDTPFTKAVIDQLNNVDINSIPTPRFPITPNFALTPALAYSPFSNRGTDYSTSSSYYQPSDTEQNKSLDQLIQECQRLEKQEMCANNEDKNIVETQKSNDPEHSTASVEAVLHDDLHSNKKIDDVNETPESVSSKTDESIHKMISEKQMAFNQSLSGKKNMHLVKMLSDEALNDSESDSGSSTDDSSFSDTDSTSSGDSPLVTPSRDNKSNPYSLRPRRTPSSSESKSQKVNTGYKNRPSKSPDLVKTNEKPLLSHKDDVLQKMEIIRQRTIAKFKDYAPATKKSSPTVKSLTKLRRETKIPAEKISKIRKSTNDESVNSSEIKAVTESQPAVPKNTPSTTDAISKSTNSEKNVSVKSKENLTIKEKLKAEYKNLPLKIKPPTAPSVKGNKCIKALQETKIKTENKTVSNEPIKLLNKPDSIAVEEENIVLHLSSDDENLEPFEMVETELLECSKSSTLLDENVKHDVVVETTKEGNEKNIDKEAETLVKGLKQWGIHLIPNKVKNKVASDVKDTKDVKLNESIKTSNTNKQSTVEARTILTESETKAMKITIGETKKATVPSQKDETTAEKPTKADIVSNTDETKSVEDESKTTVKKNNPCLKNEKKDNNQKKMKNSEQKQKVKVPHASKVNKSHIAIEEKKTIKNDERKHLLEETKCRSIEKEETFIIKHDNSTVPPRKLSDYNFDILNKTFSANVFIEEINSEVEKFLCFSRFQFLLDIPSKNLHKKVEKVKSGNDNTNSLVKKKKPLDILYNELINEPVEIHAVSPLDNLYSGTCSKEKSNVRRSSYGRCEKTERNMKHNKSINVDKCEQSKGDDNSCETNEKCLESRTGINYELESTSQNSATDNESDLMNYALIGSERVENDDEVYHTSPDKRKRKPSDELAGDNHEDKKKKTEECQELLRSIDVDSFLKQLHGDT
ncbi:hypothetical protein FQR65_LT14838 [Abscondita terminalis]|nr:hypothetical protein FQR65_LT14838 [Abscondita terminalis]